MHPTCGDPIHQHSRLFVEAFIQVELTNEKSTHPVVVQTCEIDVDESARVICEYCRATCSTTNACADHQSYDGPPHTTRTSDVLREVSASSRHPRVWCAFLPARMVSCVPELAGHPHHRFVKS